MQTKGSHPRGGMLHRGMIVLDDGGDASDGGARDVRVRPEANSNEPKGHRQAYNQCVGKDMGLAKCTLATDEERYARRCNVESFGKLLDGV
mmetsp:Transcript_46214/g.122513  ORF Transcript_46214/g.122513 Transcript_46214/m.122513 type:complete len:91 (-) Transcript_46214:139-411(-)